MLIPPLGVGEIGIQSGLLDGKRLGGPRIGLLGSTRLGLLGNLLKDNGVVEVVIFVETVTVLLNMLLLQLRLWLRLVVLVLVCKRWWTL